MTLYEILEDIKTPRKKKVVLDTDAFNEIDDQYVIAYCAKTETMELLAVHAAPFMHANCSSMELGMNQSYDEIVKVLSLVDENHNTPIMKGSTTTIDATGTYVESEAADNLIRIARESDEIIYVLTIGTSTNVTSAIMKAPDIKEKICVVWLACAQTHVWNDPVEFNLHQDYNAGRILLNSGTPLVIVPASWVTSKLRSDINNTLRLRGHNAVADYLCDITENAYNMVGRPEGWARTIWDIGAIAVMDMPDSVQYDIIPAPVLTDSRVYAFDSTRHNIIMINNIDRDPVMEKVWSIITDCPNP
ncbi:MAG: nucleoside hydrolase [Clostridia bacterium]|nr:nucleoside hydrolase [Clostridia bacterium]